MKKKDKRQKKKTKAKKAPKRSEYITMLKEWAEMGDADAYYHLGLAYMIGDDVKRNPKKAFEYFREAAVRGHPDGMFSLGGLYVTGEGGERDLEQAKLWISQAASLGNDKAREVLTDLDQSYTMLEAEANDIEEMKKKYEAGDGDAAYELSYYYKDIGDDEKSKFFLAEADRLGSGNLLLEMADQASNDGDSETALHLYQEAIEAGKVEAYLDIGCLKYQSSLSVETTQEAIDCMKKARKLGVKNASAYLANWTYNSALTQEEFEETLVYAKEAVHSTGDGFEYMSSTLQNFYSEKIYDDETLFALSKTMADHGDVLSTARVAYMYLSGEGVTKNLKEGLDYLKKAEKNYDSTLMWMRKILESRPHDLTKAVDKYAKEADELEIYEIAECYLKGVGVEKNLDKAFRYLKKAVALDVPSAQSLLGEIYLMGHYDVQKDEKKAIELLEEASRGEDPRGNYLLSRCYALGVGVPQDSDLADDYYSRYRMGEDY